MSKLKEENAYDKIATETIDKELDNYETDDNGQLILKTGVYRWADGSYHTQSEKIGLN